MGNLQDLALVGYYHFESKEKKQVYYVVQCLFNDNDNESSNNRGSLINIFVNDDVYKKIINDYTIGSIIKVEVKPNFETGKLNYKVVI